MNFVDQLYAIVSGSNGVEIGINPPGLDKEVYFKSGSEWHATASLFYDYDNTTLYISQSYDPRDPGVLGLIVTSSEVGDTQFVRVGPPIGNGRNFSYAQIGGLEINGGGFIGGRTPNSGSGIWINLNNDERITTPVSISPYVLAGSDYARSRFISLAISASAGLASLNDKWSFVADSQFTKPRLTASASLAVSSSGQIYGPHISNIVQSNLIGFNTASGEWTYFSSSLLPFSNVNIYNSNGTLTGNRTVLAIDDILMFRLSGSSEFRISDGAIAGPNTYDFFISGSRIFAQNLLPNTSQVNIVGYNTGTGQLTYFNTGSITSSFATSASYALSASFATVASTVSQYFIEVTDEGTDIGGPFTTLNFTGSGVIASNAGGGIVDIFVASSGSGGGGTPGGSDGQIQYNNGGSFGGAISMSYDDVNNRVGIGTSFPGHTLTVVGAISITGSNLNSTSLRFQDTTGASRNAMFVSSSNWLTVGNTNYEGVDLIKSARISGSLFDVNNSSGSANQVLTSTANGIAWATGGGGSVSGSQYAIPYFSSSTVLGDTSNYYEPTLGYTVFNGTTPRSVVDIENGAAPVEGLRIREPYTPTGNGDSSGFQGQITWDEDYLYVKTASGGWKRVLLDASF